MKELPKKDGRGPSIWDIFTHKYSGFLLLLFMSNINCIVVDVWYEKIDLLMAKFSFKTIVHICSSQITLI